ncbi:hypothetical protein C4544_05175 [candidate division WS5 bacterium]|uniref:DUF2190 family protein n=1 Tax=candidate division WS5 bacterium TaxID=2093353 RepID=A0A419DBD0_9BACT|nr:MAG: hypothetical protein C4544_05175 [candidate division WS5 bacterium]
MAYEIIQDIDSNPAFKLPISSITVAIGDLLERTAGATTWVLTTSSSDHFTRKAIALEAATTSDTSVLAQELTGNEKVKVESANNSNTAHNGDRMAATGENTVNNSGTDVTGQAVVFVQDGTAGAASDKRIIGRVLVGNGVDPDAS